MFNAGNIVNNYKSWTDITSDKWVLDIVSHGYKLKFDNKPEPFIHSRKSLTFSTTDNVVINSEIEKMLHSGVLKVVKQSNDQILSSIFVRPKQDGTHRLILNLKKLNECVEKHHFKMETLKSAITMIRPNVWFASSSLIFGKHIIVFQ